MPSSSTPGKRKRKAAASAEADALEDAQAIFRRHFEAQFAPLAGSGKAKSKKARARAAEGDDEDGDGDGVEDMRSDCEEEDDDENNEDDDSDEDDVNEPRNGRSDAAEPEAPNMDNRHLLSAHVVGANAAASLEVEIPGDAQLEKESL